MPEKAKQAPAADAAQGGGEPPMSYEEHLDEVTTQITERFGTSDEAAIAMVMRAQADDYFSGHDDDPSICTLERADRDAKRVFKKYGKTR